MGALPSSEGLRDRALQLLADHQAEDVFCLPAAGVVNYTDYLMLATGRSQRHQLTLAENLRQGLKVAGQPAPKIEGDTNATWLVLDLGEVVIHLQTREKREYFDLEGLWFEGGEEASPEPESQVADNL